MDDKKPSTADIMAKIRAQKAAAAAASSESSATASPPAEAAPPTAAVPPPAAAAEAPAAPKPAAPVAPTAKPGSTKDILAAIRAKGAGAAPAAPVAAVAEPVTAPAPAAAKPAVAAAATTAGPRPSVQDMLKAVREGKTVAAASAVGTKPMVAAPPAPAKPVSAAAKKAPAPQRRGLAGVVVVACISACCFIGSALTGSVLLFLAGMMVWSLVMSPFMAAWAALTEVTGLWTLHTARFMMPNVLVEPPSKFKVGPTSDYPLNTVSNKWKDQYGIWVVHTDQYEGQNLIFALASVCTHLGCTPSWLDGEQKFKCPCHGSGFYMTGVNFEGPAPRPLERMGLKIAEGMLEVDKSMKFQEEMGQWVDPASYVSVS